MEYTSKAFISHSSKDKEFAWKLVKTLNSYQLPVWFDTRELRPGDNLGNNIKEGIKEADFFIILLSENSIKSKWVKIELDEALNQQKSYTKGPRIIPTIISKCKVPKKIKDIFWVDFSKSWADGLAGLLSGIFVDRQVLKLEISKSHPLELETKDFRKWIEEFLYRGNPLAFVLDDHGLIDEISNLPATDNENEVFTLLRFSRLSMLNFCLVLPEYLKDLRAIVPTDNNFFTIAPENVQTLFKLISYDFYTFGVLRAFESGLKGDFETINSIDGCSLFQEIEEIKYESQRYAGIGRREIAALLKIRDPIDIGLTGNKGIRNMGHLLISDRLLSRADAEKWQYYDARPINEIPIGLWSKVCMPQIAAEHVNTISDNGEIISQYLNTLGLKPSDYEKMGLA